MRMRFVASGLVMASMILIVAGTALLVSRSAADSARRIGLGETSALTSASAAFNAASIDLRDYKYYRTRWGMTGSADYQLNNTSSFSFHGLYSTFRNWGQKWVYTLNDGDVPKASIDWRRMSIAGESAAALVGRYSNRRMAPCGVLSPSS